MTKGWLPYADIIDYKHNIAYFGWIENFSEYGDSREVLLRDVEVQDYQTKTFLYKTPAIYIALKDEFVVKFSSAPYHEEPEITLRSDYNEQSEQSIAATEAAATTTITSPNITSTEGNT